MIEFPYRLPKIIIGDHRSGWCDSSQSFT